MTANQSFSWNPHSAGAAAPAPARIPSLDERLEQAIPRGVDWLLAGQAPEGYWHGELEADTTLESDYILYLHVIGKFDPVRVEKLARYIRRHQLADGGWNIYANGPSELNATVKAYLGLKLAGDSPSLPHMVLARRRVHELGGLESINSFERFYLALKGRGFVIYPGKVTSADTFRIGNIGDLYPEDMRCLVDAVKDCMFWDRSSSDRGPARSSVMV